MDVAKLKVVNLLGKRKLYIETYGCQMNVNDSEVVASVLKDHDFEVTVEMSQADVILVNTCSVRENAEQRVRGRLQVFKQFQKSRPHLLIGVIGCMAERLKENLLEEEKMVDLVVGPDAYRDLPQLLAQAGTGQKAVNVLLSREETYADINPVRLDENKVSSFVSIMRGCNNMCTYCIVPHTRGRERSRDYQTILKEISQLQEDGYKEVTLLGQNVDSYHWKKDSDVNFAALLKIAAVKFPNIRFRFSTSHPKDISDEVIETMASHQNICKSIHLPVQSGSDRMLDQMKRRYNRDYYMTRVALIKKLMPECTISTDIIAGFCGEEEVDHKQTLNLMKLVAYDSAFMFKYSVRPGTYAADHLEDSVPEDIKSRRLTEIIELQNSLSLESNKRDIGKVFEVLVEGFSKKSSDFLYGRNSQNKTIIFPKAHFKPGDIAMVRVEKCTQATLMGVLLEQ